ncbi:hypothetical protein BD408DRAFT_409830 [Parasitella parasitica]|nr:hypothetical protein BD408DRAFT_409830 [Parasitella parasitica]
MTSLTPTFAAHVTFAPSRLASFLVLPTSVTTPPASVQPQLMHTSSQHSSDTPAAFHSSASTIALSTPSSAAPDATPTSDDEGEDDQGDENHNDNEDDEDGGDGDNRNDYKEIDDD